MSSCFHCLTTKTSDSQQPKANTQEMDAEQKKNNSKSSGDGESSREEIHTNQTKNNVESAVDQNSCPADLVLFARDKDTTDTKSEHKSESESFETVCMDNLFDPKYELWKVTSNRVKLKFQEHRKSRRICELSRGAVVRCVARPRGSKRFKVDLPLVGWCSLSRSSRSSNEAKNAPQFERVDPSMLPVIDSRFVLELKVGQGSFGKVFVAWDLIKNKQVALKIDQPKSGKRTMFDREIAIMKLVTKCKSVPSLLYCGCVRSHTESGKECPGGSNYKSLQYMIMDLEGLSLSILYKKYLTNFSLKTVMMLGVVIVRMLRQVHQVGVLHRDIKPANFVISRGDNGRNIKILDFGLSIRYTKDNGSHVEYRKGCRRCGTARYSSINTHKRIRQSRRDDLEATGYVLLLFLRGLPWRQRKGEEPEKKWSRILEEKLRWKISELCNKLEPSVGQMFCEYFKYCRKLKYSDRPNYHYLVALFKKTLEQNKAKLDFTYDWCEFI